jgi:hypothetical protein
LRVSDEKEEAPTEKPVLLLLRGGDEETRTPDLLHAKQALYQLSYIPTPEEGE